MQKFDEEEVLRNNPGVDRDQMREVRELRKKLRAAGLPDASPPGYRLAPPFTRVPSGKRGRRKPQD